MRTCSITDCGRKHHARGLCGKHHGRWKAHGDPQVGASRFATPEEAFLARTEPLVWSSCVVWTGHTDSSGYGRLRVNGRVVRAHRYAWECENGPIPDGMFIDHRCYERSCVNVDHLRLATHQQNSANRSGAHGDRKHDLPRGVYRHGRGYRVQITVGGVRHHLGTFSTPEEASAAAQTKRAILFGEFAGGA